VTAPTDPSVAQTAAAVENVLISAYAKLAALPSMRGLGLEAFLAATVQQHGDHLAAFNAVATRLGGKAQTGLDEAFMTSVVEPGIAAVASPLEAVMFCAKLEMIAAATYSADVATVSDHGLRSALAETAGVECQHQGVLLVAASVLSAGGAALALPLPPRRLPVALQGPPTAFLRTDLARPGGEGAVR